LPNRNVEIFERGFLQWIAQDAMARAVRGVPASRREAVVSQMRDEMRDLLIHTPTEKDAILDVRARAEIAVAFGVRFPDACGSD
jgi:hypothetical protein